MTISQKDFYELPEVVEQINIQKVNPYGSEAHKTAYLSIVQIAKDCGVYEQYKAAGGDDY